MLAGSILQDVRQGLRGFRKDLSFSITAIVITALGVGATSAVFSVVDRLFIRSLPYSQPDQLVAIGIKHPIFDAQFLLSSDFDRLREQQVLSEVTSWRGIADCDLTEDNPVRLSCAPVAWNFLPVLGTAPLLGRNFTPAEDRPQGGNVALISHGIWLSRFGGDPAVVGKLLPVDGVPREIIGVLPSDFELPTLQRADILIPQALKPRQPGALGTPIRVFGRIKEGTSIDETRSRLAPFFASSVEFMSPQMRKSAKVTLTSLRDFQIQDVQFASCVLFSATVAMLLIGCANVANLLLVRAASREREIAVRSALGAGRGRLVRQVLTESLLLSFAGALAGCVLSAGLLRVFKVLAPGSIPRMQQATVDGRVLIFSAGLALVCGIVFGLAPALVNPRREALIGSRSGVKPRKAMRGALAVAQIAVSLILLGTAGLLLGSLWKMQNQGSGVDAQHVVTAEISVGPKRYPNSIRRQQFFDEVAQRLEARPGVLAVAVSDTVPPSGFIHTRPLSALRIPGQPAAEPGSGGMVSWRSVSSGYFAALGIPIVRGRAFNDSEHTSPEETMIVSALLARRLFPGADPLGRSIQLVNGPPFTVIGVAGDADNAGIPGRSDPEYYVLRKQITDPNAGLNQDLALRSLHIYDGTAFIIVRTTVSLNVIASWIRSEVGAQDPTVPVTVATMRQRVNSVSERQRFEALLLVFFAIVGVVVATAGLYGLISFIVVQGAKDIGIRIALGSTPVRTVMLIMKDALLWTALGVLAGLAGTVAASRLLRSVLFDVRPQDQLPFVLVAIILGVISISASVAPAVRAARTDPMSTLQME